MGGKTRFRNFFPLNHLSQHELEIKDGMEVYFSELQGNLLDKHEKFELIILGVEHFNSFKMWPVFSMETN